MTDTELPVRRKIIRLSRHLASIGLSPGSSGNISVRLGSSILITPTGSALSRVTGDELASVQLDGRVLSGSPSKELPLHLAVYTRRPHARAVVHLHSPYATALSCLPPLGGGHTALPNYTPYRVMRLGLVPLAIYSAPGSAELAAGVDDLAATHPVILLANHGPVVASESLEGAVDLAEELETAARLTFLLRDHHARALDDVAQENLRK